MKKIFDILLFILLCVTPIFFVILLATQWSDLQSPQRVLLIDFVILDVAVLVNVIHKYFWSRSMNKLFKEFRNPGRRNNTMFKRKNKNANKTGIHTPKFRNPIPPPPPSMPPTSGSNAVKPKHIAHGYIGTKEGFVHFAEQHDGLVKIENAEIYWIAESESIVVVASPEWRDYLTGRRDTPIVEKENN